MPPALESPARPPRRARRPLRARPPRRVGPAHDDARRAARPAARAAARRRSSGSRTNAPPPRSRRRGSTSSTADGRAGRARRATSCASPAATGSAPGASPAELAAELAQRRARGPGRWQTRARRDDFAAFAPALRRNVELARAYAACFDDVAQPLRRAAGRLRLRPHRRARRDGLRPRSPSALPPLVAEAAGSRRRAAARVAVDAQRAAVARCSRAIGVDADELARRRLGAPVHRLASGRRDSRVTTRYEDGELQSVLAAMHEFGHALYERQIAPELDRTNLGRGTSMSMHESQSKLWENHVGRNRGVRAGARRRAGAAAASRRRRPRCTRRSSRVRPSLIRVSADPVTYPLHIVLRFELELALIEGDARRRRPARRRGTTACGGCSASRSPTTRTACLQDVHWAGGAFGYFPSYALGLPDRRAAVGGAGGATPAPQDDALRRGERRDPRRGWPSTSTATAAGWTPSRWSSAATGRGHRRGAVPAPRDHVRARLTGGGSPTGGPLDSRLTGGVASVEAHRPGARPEQGRWQVPIEEGSR